MMTHIKHSYYLIGLILAVAAAGAWAQSGVDIGIQIIPQYEPVKSGEGMFVAIELTIPSNGHLYANPKQGEMGLDTEVTATAPGVRFGKPIYPVGTKYLDKILQATNYVYHDRAVIYLPVEVPAKIENELSIELGFAGLFCTDDGSCVPWEDHKTAVLTVGSESVAKAKALFEKQDIQKVQWLEPQPGAADMGNDDGGGDSSGGGSDGGLSAEGVVIPDYQPVEFSEGGGMTGLKAILLAFIAGLILNIMPCVLPVIPLKVLSLIQQAQSGDGETDRFKSLKLALVFSFGIILVFVILAAVMSGFKLFYGQQFQSDVFKFFMLAIIYLLTLSMMGLFEIVLPAGMTNVNIVKQGYAGSMGMGIMATLLATPCSAPLLGPVLVWSLGRATPVTIGVFIMVGVGMAAPYVLLTAFPKLLNRVPKAGTWMLRLKEGLSFVMLGVCVYLISLFPAVWFVPLVVYCIVVGFAAWLAFKAVSYSTPNPRRMVTRLVALLIFAGSTVVLWQNPPESLGSEVNQAPAAEVSENWLVSKLLPLHEAGQTVMVEFTADWCPNCKAVELTVLKREAFKAKLEETDTQLILADLTRDDPAVKTLLTRLGSQSIPFTAIFPGNDPLHPIVLRDVYTLNMVSAALDRAAGK